MGVTYYLCKNCGREVSGPEDVCICQEIDTLRAKLAHVEQERDAMRADKQLVANAVIEIKHRAEKAEAAAQQSAQEQYRKGMERAVEIIGNFAICQANAWARGALYRAAGAIRTELSKGEGK